MVTKTPLFGSPGNRLSRRDALGILGLTVASTIAQGMLAPTGARGADPKPAAAEPPPIASQSLAAGVALISGAGGNVAVLAGPDGALVVDSGLAGTSAGIIAEIGKVAPGPLALLVNTHWHFDHVGGNERIAASGARIVASENCRKRMSKDQFNDFLKKDMPASPRSALPIVTLSHATTLFLNDEEIRLLPVAPAHTDGDIFVHFQKANVLHLGDVFFNGAYPFIDYSSEGWIGGMITAAKAGLALTNSSTKIIPGHGPLASPEDLKAYIGVLETVHERMSKAKAAGKTADELVAEGATKDFDAKYGNGFMSPDKFIRCAYAGLLKHG